MKSGDFAQNLSLAPRPAKMNPDDHPLRDEIDDEKVKHDKSANRYRRDSNEPHSKENTLVLPCLAVE